MTTTSHFTLSPTRRQVGLFILLVLALGVGFAVFPVLTPFYMFSPALAALLTLILTRDLRLRTLGHDLGLNRLDLRRWPAALFLPALALTPGYVMLTALGRVQWDARLAQYTWLGGAIYVVFTLILNTLTFSLGEEIGWRGFLLPRLLELGPARASLLTGVIWAIWHYPLIFLGQGYLPLGPRLPLTLLFTLTLMAISVVIGRLWAYRRSLWVAALFHSAHNTVWGLWSNLVLATPVVGLWAGESGLIPLALYTLLALALGWKGRAEMPDAVRSKPPEGIGDPRVP